MLYKYHSLWRLFSCAGGWEKWYGGVWREPEKPPWRTVALLRTKAVCELDSQDGDSQGDKPLPCFLFTRSCSACLGSLRALSDPGIHLGLRLTNYGEVGTHAALSAQGGQPLNGPGFWVLPPA